MNTITLLPVMCPDNRTNTCPVVNHVLYSGGPIFEENGCISCPTEEYELPAGFRLGLDNSGIENIFEDGYSYPCHIDTRNQCPVLQGAGNKIYRLQKVKI